MDIGIMSVQFVVLKGYLSKREGDKMSDRINCSHKQLYNCSHNISFDTYMTCMHIYLDLPPERNVVVLRLMRLLRLGLRLLLGVGRLELRLVAFLDLLDDPLAESIIAGAANVSS